MPSGQIIARTTNTWLVRLCQGRDPETGKRRYFNKTVHGERTSAEAELSRLLSQIPARPESTSSLDVYLDWWLHAAVDCRLRAKTARDYRTLLARYVRPELGHVKLSRLKPLDLQSLLLSLTSRRLSARTVRYTHAVLRSALDQARRWKLLVENPAADMPLPRADKREFRVLTPEEAQRFTSFCLEDPERLVLLVALTTGLRPSEYLALRAADFDRSRSTLTITRTLERARREWRFADTKRPRSRRTVALPFEVARLIANHIDSRELAPSRLLFESSRRGPLHERNLVQRVFKPLLKANGLPNIRLYDLRHTFATLALFHGSPPRLISEQLGHGSVAFTLETYGHLLETTRAAIADGFSALLFAAPERKLSASHQAEATAREIAG
jgi:integrase